jgi:hypothetical protein
MALFNEDKDGGEYLDIRIAFWETISIAHIWANSDEFDK